MNEAFPTQGSETPSGFGQVTSQTPPPTPRRRRRVWPWLLGALLLVVLGVSLLLNLVMAVGLAVQLAGPSDMREQLVSGDPLAKEKIALVSLKGAIVDATGAFGRSGTFRSTVEELEQAASDPATKAVCLLVDSPGGEVTASDVLCHKVRQLREKTGKPVVVSMGSVGTSGAYYVSVGADRIVAHPTAVTGNIGVLMTLINAQGLMEKVGLRSMVLKSAEHKDLGSPFREMTTEEQSLLQGVLDHLFTRFKQTVAEGRGMSPAKVDVLANGRIFTAQEALESGLIDSIGYLEDAIAEAKKLAGTPDAKVVRYERPFRLSRLFASELEALASPRSLTVNVTGLPEPHTARFLYMWVLGNQVPSE